MLLTSKLKHLKIEIKKWRAVEFNKEEQVLKDLNRRLIGLARLVETRDLSTLEINEVRDGKVKLADLEQLHRLDLKQIAHIKWAMDGDENSSFFHGTLKNKNRSIHGLTVNGRWIVDRIAIKEEAFHFFDNKFHEKWPICPLFINSLFDRLSDVQRDSIEEPFTLGEIKSAIWACGGEKAPGPNDITFNLIKTHFDIFSSEVMGFIRHIEAAGSIARGSNSSFITLFPKIKDPINLCDYPLFT